jgi:hypothetical protein
MTFADLVYEQMKTLPDPLAREVLDFIGYLRERGESREWRDLMNAQAPALADAWDSPEDQVWDNVWARRPAFGAVPVLGPVGEQTRHAARLVQQERLNGDPFIIGEFVAHDSRLRFGSLNHAPGDAINPLRSVEADPIP